MRILVAVDDSENARRAVQYIGSGSFTPDAARRNPAAR